MTALNTECPWYEFVSFHLVENTEIPAKTNIFDTERLKLNNIASLPAMEGVSGRYIGDYKDEELLAKAMDDSAARKLWDICEEMVDILK